ncbi:Flp family type IVb pilin [Nocardioides sp. 1609]|uniref:Flp family type IVb pilin n=1 Tax=Nocardioides sp. 1609 TaxID=2508327 RepID=UPI00106F42A8|nr:Flp family type IVb pilin [Nocardioides sp. 1609]
MTKSRKDDRGASAVEYGLILVGIAALIVVIVVLLGSQVGSMFGDTCDKIQEETGAAPEGGNCQGD